MTSTFRSSLQSLRAEISFRKFHNRIHKPVLEYMELAYRERSPVFSQLLKGRGPFSPFLELGAETAANSLALVNDLGASGIAGDISPDSLMAISMYGEKMNRKKAPYPVVLDAHNLPFINDSLPFIFSWGSLHHFRKPALVLKEVRRVMSPGGLFFFDGEPVKRKLSANLWTTKAYQFMNWFEKAVLRAGILPYLAAIDGAEALKAGVDEKKLPMAKWEELMTCFDNVKWRYSPYITAEIPAAGQFPQKIVSRIVGADRAKREVVSLFGGAVGGECQFVKASKGDPVLNIEQAFACPDCTKSKERPGLVKRENYFRCKECGRKFHKRDGILFLLSTFFRYGEFFN